MGELYFFHLPETKEYKFVARCGQKKTIWAVYQQGLFSRESFSYRPET
jgi:hypothetical protein